MKQGRPRSLLTMSTEMLKTSMGLLEVRLQKGEVDNKALAWVIKTLYIIQQQELKVDGEKEPGKLPHRYQRLKTLPAGPEGTMEDPWEALEKKEAATNGADG